MVTPLTKGNLQVYYPLTLYIAVNTPLIIFPMMYFTSRDYICIYVYICNIYYVYT